MIRRLALRDVEAGSRVLASAFESYPWTRWVLPGSDYPERLRALFTVYLEHACAHGVPITDANMRGLAVFMPAGAPVPSGEVMTRIAHLHGDGLDRLASVKTPQAPADAWTLETLGVAPDRQGEGLGGQLLTHGLAIVDSAGAPAWLETSDPANVRLYQRHGFEEKVTTPVAAGLEVVSMLRPARGISRRAL